MSQHRILGIDPGSYHLGVGFIEKKGPTLKLLYVDVLHAKKTDTFYDRLAFLSDKLNALLDAHQPSEVALEDIFFAKNARSAFQIGIVRGVVVAKCLDRRIKIVEYAPTTVKSVVTGYGKADKSQVRKMVGLTLGEKFPDELALDGTDALALAICHASQTRLGRLNC